MKKSAGSVCGLGKCVMIYRKILKRQERKSADQELPVIGQIIGIVIDVGESIAQKTKEEKFKKIVDGIVENFENQRKELLEFLDNEDKFIPQFFPDYTGLLTQIEDIQHELREKESLHEKFQNWREQGESIEAEFRTIVQG
jgi:uncharacterized membrane-anchored protein YhcB (DUF1043 family)